MTLQVNMDGRPIDGKLSELQLAEAHQEEKESALIDDHINTYSEGYQHLGSLSPRRMGNGELSVTITEDHLKWMPKDVRSRRAEGKKVIPVSYIEHEGHTHWVLNDADGIAMRDGYICENCLEWQESNISLQCKTIHGKSCGHVR